MASTSSSSTEPATRRARSPGSPFDSDFDAAIHLIGELRAEKPDLYVNLTTGTYPSPFWLRYADSIWRGGEDHDFAGVGTSRQRWITYRDADTYEHVVRAGALFPLNSLMLHGMIYARHGAQPEDRPAAAISRRRSASTSAPARSCRRCTSRRRCSRGELGHDRRRREVVARECGHAGGHALDRRRSAAARALRMGVVVVRKGIVTLRNPGNVAQNDRDRRRARIRAAAFRTTQVFRDEPMDPVPRQGARHVPRWRSAHGSARSIRGSDARDEVELILFSVAALCEANRTLPNAADIA